MSAYMVYSCTNTHIRQLYCVANMWQKQQTVRKRNKTTTVLQPILEYMQARPGYNTIETELALLQHVATDHTMTKITNRKNKSDVIPGINPLVPEFCFPLILRYNLR